MKVSFTGFNLYKTFIFNKEPLVESFTNFNHADATNMEIQHSYAVIWYHGKDSIQISGLSQDKDLSDNCQYVKLPNIIQEISCADTKILILSEIGDIYKFQLEELIKGKVDPVRIPNLLSSVDIQSGDKIVHIACGYAMNVAVSKLGKVFSVPNELRFKNDEIIEVCVGQEHCLLLDNDGKVYSFGCGR